MDINNYRFYVKDLGITDDDLSLVLQDVINDIATSTNIFKSVFSFTLEKDTYVYNIKSLFDLDERIREKPASITIDPYSEDDLVRYLNEPSTLGVNTTETYEDNVYYNQYLSCDDIMKLIPKRTKYSKDSDSIISIFDYFTQIDNTSFKINIDVNKYIEDAKYDSNGNSINPNAQTEIPVLCPVTIIPNINNISSELENIIKVAVIEGLKYFISPMNAANEQFRYNNWLRYHKAMVALMSRYPTNIGQQRKKDNFIYLKDKEGDIF